jgi:hypothetical protein
MVLKALLPAPEPVQGRRDNMLSQRKIMKNMYMILAMSAVGLNLGTDVKAGELGPMDPPPRQAQSRQPGLSMPGSARIEAVSEHSFLQVTHLIGREVQNDRRHHLGIVQDVILSLDPDSAPAAIVKYGGAFGIGGTRVAVPLKDLKWSDDAQTFTLATSRDQFQFAASTPTGGWVALAGQEWAARVDRFYGDPAEVDPAASMEAPPSSNLTREYIRDAIQLGPTNASENLLLDTEPGAAMSRSQPADDDLVQLRVTKLIDLYVYGGTNIQVSVQKGIVTLKGRMQDASQKDDIETRIKAVDGVSALIDDQLSIPAN